MENYKFIYIDIDFKYLKTKTCTNEKWHLFCFDFVKTVTETNEFKQKKNKKLTCILFSTNTLYRHMFNTLSMCE